MQRSTPRWRRALYWVLHNGLLNGGPVGRPFELVLGPTLESKMKDTNAIDQERCRRGAELAADMRDAMSFTPLPPSPAEVGDLILQTREHVQALGWGNREHLYTASQVMALMSKCEIMAAARERERTMFSRRPGLWALRARDVLELIAAPMRPDGTWNRDREACRQMAAEALGRYED